MKQFNVFLCSLFEILTVIFIVKSSCYAQEGMPMPQGGAILEVTEFTGGIDAKFNKPFTVRYLKFKDNIIPEPAKLHTAQWIYPPEGICEGSLVFRDEGVNVDPSKLKPEERSSWQMNCRSGWSALGFLSLSDKPGHYNAEGFSAAGKKVAFKLSPVTKTGK